MRMFNDVVSHIMQSRTSEDLNKFFQRVDDAAEKVKIFVGDWLSLDGAESCLEFLDFYFTFCVEWSPSGMFLVLHVIISSHSLF